MNTYAVLMQTGSMSSAGQWVVIGLTVASLMAAWLVAGAQQMSERAVRVVVALVIAVVFVALATPTYATVFIPCTDPAGIPWYWWLTWSC
jgi:hypothetical protein